MKICALWFCFAVAATGCAALFQKSEPLTVRYYAPEERSGRFATQGVSSGASVRLGRVAAAAHLDARMLRRSKQTLTYQDAARWSENPARFVERGLAHALFEERGIPQAISGRALTLEADLIAFEELQSDPPSVRVSITWTLHDERTSRIRETVSAERELSAGDTSPSAVAVGLSHALDECIDRIATRTQQALAP